MESIDELLGRRRRLSQDAEPAERVDAEVVLAHAPFRNSRPADAVTAVAAGDEVADELFFFTLLRGEADLRLVGRDVLQSARFGLEVDLAARLKPELDQILEHLVLGVDGNDAAVGKIVQVDAVAAAGKAQLEAVVHEALALHTLASADLGHEVDGGLLQHAGPDGGFDRLTRAALDDHRVD